MALQNFGPSSYVLTINGRIMSDFGETASPAQDSPIDAKRVLRRGQGGKAVQLERINPGRTFNLYLNPGSPDSAFTQALFNSGAAVTLAYTVLGSLEGAIGTDGVVVNDAANNRAGSTVSDDQYTFEFNSWNATKGG